MGLIKTKNETNCFILKRKKEKRNRTNTKGHAPDSGPDTGTQKMQTTLSQELPTSAKHPVARCSGRAPCAHIEPGRQMRRVFPMALSCNLCFPNCPSHGSAPYHLCSRRVVASGLGYRERGSSCRDTGREDGFLTTKYLTCMRAEEG